MSIIISSLGSERSLPSDKFRHLPGQLSFLVTGAGHRVNRNEQIIEPFSPEQLKPIKRDPLMG